MFVCFSSLANVSFTVSFSQLARRLTWNDLTTTYVDCVLGVLVARLLLFLRANHACTPTVRHTLSDVSHRAAFMVVICSMASSSHIINSWALFSLNTLTHTNSQSLTLISIKANACLPVDFFNNNNKSVLVMSKRLSHPQSKIIPWLWRSHCERWGAEGWPEGAQTTVTNWAQWRVYVSISSTWWLKIYVLFFLFWSGSKWIWWHVTGHVCVRCSSFSFWFILMRSKSFLTTYLVYLKHPASVDKHRKAFRRNLRWQRPKDDYTVCLLCLSFIVTDITDHDPAVHISVSGVTKPGLK